MSQHKYKQDTNTSIPEIQIDQRYEIQYGSVHSCAIFPNNEILEHAGKGSNKIEPKGMILEHFTPTNKMGFGSMLN